MSLIEMDSATTRRIRVRKFGASLYTSLKYEGSAPDPNDPPDAPVIHCDPKSTSTTTAVWSEVPMVRVLSSWQTSHLNPLIGAERKA